MKIAVPCDENGEFFEFTGHTPAFMVYDIEDGKVIKEETLFTNGLHHEQLPELLKDNEVNVLLCNHMNSIILSLLMERGIETCTNVLGTCDSIVEEYLDNTLAYSKEPNCPHCHN